MREFLKTTKGKVLITLTILAVIAASLGVFKVWSQPKIYFDAR